MSSNAKVNGNPKRLTRRGKTSAKSEPATDHQAQTKNTENPEQVRSIVSEKVASDRKQAGIQLYQRPGLPELQMRDTTLARPANRPVSSSPIQISETLSLMGNRPIESSNFHVLHTYMGNRPVAANEISMREVYSLSGSRPVSASTLNISDIYSVMGNRPVASNESDESGTLMGFID